MGNEVYEDNCYVFCLRSVSSENNLYIYVSGHKNEKNSLLRNIRKSIETLKNTLKKCRFQVV